MKIDKKIEFLITAGAGIFVIAAAFFALVVFFGGESIDRGTPLLHLALILVFYTVACTALVGLKAKLFDAGALKSADAQTYSDVLEKLGAVPLKTLTLIAICSLAFLITAVNLGALFGIAQRMKTPLFLLGFSIALLGAAFVYVLSDRLVTKTLSDNNLVNYPRGLREGRQSLKIFIVPIAVTVISILYTLGLSLLTSAKSAKPVTEMSLGEWALLLWLIFPFFTIVLCLAALIKQNTGALYSTIIAQFENLSSAKKDLTRRVNICSVDEVGTIAGMVNEFCQNMEQWIREIKTSQEALSSSGITLKHEAAVMVDSLARLSEGVELVRQKSEGQTRGVNESADVIRETAKNIELLGASVACQGSSVNQASESVEAMVRNSKSIASMVERMLNQFKTAASAASEGGQIQKEGGERVQEIVAESEILQEANRIIASIANQTNLLAMNAAIEAAHAGQAGSGFAVVADEIRKLAETSSKESAKISAQLKQITETINNIVKGTNAATQAFEHVAERINNTERLMLEVNDAVIEQQGGADQVLQSLSVMNDITGEVSAGSKEMSKGNKKMLDEMAKLQNGFGQISTGIEEMAGSITQVNGGALKVSDLAENNQTAISGITGVVDEFEV